MGERLRDWVGTRVSVIFTNDETQFGDLLEAGDDYIVLQVGSLKYVINLHTVVRVNQIREQ